MNGLARLRSPRTTRLMVVTLLWITRTLASLLVAFPLVWAITSTGLVSGPEQDGLLFQPGALGLLELIRTGAPVLASGAKSSLLFAGICGVLGLVSLAFVLELLESQDTDGVGSALLRGFRVFPRFLGLSAITLLAQAAVLLAASLLEAALAAGLHGQSERLLTLAPIALVGMGLLYCAWLGALQDIARGIVIQRDLPTRAALREALISLRDDRWAVLLGSYPSSMASLFAWLCAAWIMTRLDLSATTHTLVLAFAVHQLAILSSIALRVRWLAYALTLGARGSSARS